jgi:hypothetical protein
MAAVAVAAAALDCHHQESEPTGCATQRRHHHDAGVAELVQDAGDGCADRLLHAVHQGVSSARGQLQKPRDGIASDAGWQFVGAVGVLRHGFVDTEFAYDGAPWCFGLQLLGVLPQSLC